MKAFILALVTSLLNLNTSDGSANIADIVVKDIELKEVNLADYKGKVLWRQI